MASPHRILVVGAQDRVGSEVQDALAAAAVGHVVSWGPQTITVVTGGASGLDRVAEDWAAEFGYRVRRFRADWTLHGRRAPVVRDREMLAAGGEVCLAFPGPDLKETWPVIRAAVTARIETRIYPLRG